jgi:hypothetical protein
MKFGANNNIFHLLAVGNSFDEYDPLSKNSHFRKLLQVFPVNVLRLYLNQKNTEGEAPFHLLFKKDTSSSYTNLDMTQQITRSDSIKFSKIELFLDLFLTILPYVKDYSLFELEDFLQYYGDNYLKKFATSGSVVEAWSCYLKFLEEIQGLSGKIHHLVTYSQGLFTKLGGVTCGPLSMIRGYIGFNSNGTYKFTELKIGNCRRQRRSIPIN